MDPINILVGLNLIASFTGNLGGSKAGFKSKLTEVKERPKSFLQKWPPNLSAAALVLVVLGIFQIGTFQDGDNATLLIIRLIGFAMFIIFSWLQIFVYKSLGESYTQDVAVLKKHKLKTDGYYKSIRHPQYLTQILSDLGAGIALLSYLVVPMVLLIELPLFIMRARMEEKLLLKHLPEEYSEYRKRSGFIIPFIG